MASEATAVIVKQVNGSFAHVPSETACDSGYTPKHQCIFPVPHSHRIDEKDSMSICGLAFCHICKLKWKSENEKHSCQIHLTGSSGLNNDVTNPTIEALVTDDYSDPFDPIIDIPSTPNIELSIINASSPLPQPICNDSPSSFINTVQDGDIV
eukprot:scaffold252268_cov45-Attheya_sp.AAC.3